eukprot:1369780-Amorphochlora_amoeboformis.AAC.1
MVRERDLKCLGVIPDPYKMGFGERQRERRGRDRAREKCEKRNDRNLGGTERERVKIDRWIERQREAMKGRRDKVLGDLGFWGGTETGQCGCRCRCGWVRGSEGV